MSETKVTTRDEMLKLLDELRGAPGMRVAFKLQVVGETEVLEGYAQMVGKPLSRQSPPWPLGRSQFTSWDEAEE